MQFNLFRLDFIKHYIGKMCVKYGPEYSFAVCCIINKNTEKSPSCLFCRAKIVFQQVIIYFIFYIFIVLVVKILDIVINIRKVKYLSEHRMYRTNNRRAMCIKALTQ